MHESTAINFSERVGAASAADQHFYDVGDMIKRF